MTKTNAAESYFGKTMALLQHLRDTQLDHIEQAAQICAHSIARLVWRFWADQVDEGAVIRCERR